MKIEACPYSSSPISFYHETEEVLLEPITRLHGRLERYGADSR